MGFWNYISVVQRGSGIQYLVSPARAYFTPVSVSDTTNIPVQTIIILASQNQSLPCPGVSEHSLVQELEWIFLTHPTKLVGFMSDTTTVYRNQLRISLQQDSFALVLHPALAEDSGDYICLVNSRPAPDGVVRLIVQGSFCRL